MMGKYRCPLCNSDDTEKMREIYVAVSEAEGPDFEVTCCYACQEALYDAFQAGIHKITSERDRHK